MVDRHLGNDTGGSDCRTEIRNRLGSRSRIIHGFEVQNKYASAFHSLRPCRLVNATTRRTGDVLRPALCGGRFDRRRSAHYTYAEVPFGFWLQHSFGLSRNPFDRLVHFAYGFLLVYPLRDLLRRLAGGKGFWSYYLPVSGILAQSGLFEVIEAAVAQTVSPELGAAYLGTQGDEWDAQKDMMAALTGAVMMASLIWLVERRGGASGETQNNGPTAGVVM